MAILSDKDMASNVLMLEKSIAERYHWSALEAFNQPVLQTMLQLHDEIHRNARRVFDYMNRKGWYQPRAADAATVQWVQNAVRQSQQEVGTVMHNLPPVGQPAREPVFAGTGAGIGAAPGAAPGGWAGPVYQRF